MAAKKSAKSARKRKPQKPRAVPGEWQERFLTAYGQSGIVGVACKEAGVDRSTVLKNREASKEFAARMRRARTEAADALEGIARQRAEACSDRLMIFLLSSLRPKKYRANVKHEHTGKVNVEVSAKELTDDELATIARKRAG